MKWLEIPIDELKQFDKDWEHRRTNVDGTKALIHEEIYNELIPSVMLLDSENTEIQYPFPIFTAEDIMNSSDYNQIKL